jgi:hypothetical protein
MAASGILRGAESACQHAYAQCLRWVEGERVLLYAGTTRAGLALKGSPWRGTGASTMCSYASVATNKSLVTMIGWASTDNAR